MPIPNNAQRAETARESAAAALDAQRYLRSGTPNDAAAEARDAQAELRDNQVRPART